MIYFQIENDVELAESDGYNTLHTSGSSQTVGADTQTIVSSDIVIKRTVDGAYDNPTVSAKD